MTKKRLYPYCDVSDIPSEEVVARFYKPNKTICDPRDNVKSDYESEYGNPQEALWADLEGFYRAYGDWTTALACMNID